MCDTDLIYSLYETNHGHDPSNKIHPTAIIYPGVKIGKNNIIGAYCVIGGNGEIRGTEVFEGSVEIGDGNVFSEFINVHRPKVAGQITRIGNNNIIMAHSHIAHDCNIGDNTEICAGVVLAGYVTVKDKAKLKVGVTVRNRKTIGEGALVGIGSVVVSDIPDGEVVVGVPAKPFKK
jgi:UDP-N-acetylglucosamine acyltransferase